MSAQLPSGIPDRVGDYILAERVGYGGMADVFRAERRSLGGFVKTVAIKRILPHLLGNENFVKMFIDEARIAASLSHANIVSIYDFGQTGDELFLVMEFVDGYSLLTVMRNLAERGRPLPLRHALFITLEVCKGLQAAHSRIVHGSSAPVVHRDISPQNILVSHGGEVKITDFGVAKAHGRISTTQADTLKGKISYMAPEHMRGEDVDARSDIFSVGVVLHEMLSGTRLFRGVHQADTLMQVLHKDIPEPSAVRLKLPAEIDRITMKALARERGSRYQRVAELGRDISQFLLATGIEATGFAFADFLAGAMPEGSGRASPKKPAVGDSRQLGQILDDLGGSPPEPASGALKDELAKARGRPLSGSAGEDTAVDDRERRRFMEIAKDLAGEVHSRSDVELWVQVALLGKMATLATDSSKHAKLVEALLAAADGRLDPDEPE